MQRQWPSLNAFNTRYVQWEIGGSQEFCRTKINVMHSLQMWKHRNIRSFLTVQFTSPRIIWIFQKWYNRTQVAGSRLKSMFFHRGLLSFLTRLNEKRNQWVISVSFSQKQQQRPSVESVELVFTDYLLTASRVKLGNCYFVLRIKIFHDQCFYQKRGGIRQ